MANNNVLHDQILLLAPRDVIENLSKFSQVFNKSEAKGNNIKQDIFTDACAIINEQLKTNESLKQNLIHTRKQHEIFIGIKYITLWGIFAIFSLFILVCVVGGAWGIIQDIRKNNWWICERTTVEDYRITQPQSKDKSQDISSISAKSGQNITEIPQFCRKTISEPTYGQLITIGFFYLIVYGSIIVVLGYAWLSYKKFLQQDKLEQDIHEKYEPRLKRLLAYKKYRDKYGEKYIDLMFDIIKDLYPDK